MRKAKGLRIVYNAQGSVLIVYNEHNIVRIVYNAQEVLRIVYNAQIVQIEYDIYISMCVNVSRC